jgi:hypothetical protein
MINQLRFLNATGAAAIAVTLAPNAQFRVLEVRVHLSAAGGAGNLTLTVDANAGADYDTVIKTQDMTLVTDFTEQPTTPYYFDEGDTLKIAWANANTRTYGLTIVYEVF